MTNKEQKTIDSLLQVVTDLKNENRNFREDTNAQIEAINQKLQKVYKPVSLEQEILNTARQSINETITKSITGGYNSPMSNLVGIVIRENETELKQLVSDCFLEVIRNDNFKKDITDAFSHKVARNIISSNDSVLDKVSNELKNDTVFKSKLTLLIAELVDNFKK
jgi:hypothetical protein